MNAIRGRGSHIEVLNETKIIAVKYIYIGFCSLSNPTVIFVRGALYCFFFAQVYTCFWAVHMWGLLGC